MPRLDEGFILIETRKLPGISLTDSVEISKRIERTLRAFPEVAEIRGLDYNFTQPMAMRVDETVSGVKADLANKIFGDDLNTFDSLSQQILRAVS
jgi:cobalt-zinc-cadmium resistance protein CzcA